MSTGTWLVRLLTLLIELNRMGKTVLIATHDLNLIRARVQARVLRLTKGGCSSRGGSLMPGILRDLLVGRPSDRVVPPGAQSALSVGFAAVMAFFGPPRSRSRFRFRPAGRLPRRASSRATRDAADHRAAGSGRGPGRAALNVLKTTPGIVSVRVVTLEARRRCFEPLGSADLRGREPALPLMIEVTVDRDRLNQDSLGLRLSAEAPGAVFDDHSAWRQPPRGDGGTA